MNICDFWWETTLRDARAMNLDDMRTTRLRLESMAATYLKRRLTHPEKALLISTMKEAAILLEQAQRAEERRLEHVRVGGLP